MWRRTKWIPAAMCTVSVRGSAICHMPLLKPLPFESQCCRACVCIPTIDSVFWLEVYVSKRRTALNPPRTGDCAPRVPDRKWSAATNVSRLLVPAVCSILLKVPKTPISPIPTAFYAPLNI